MFNNHLKENITEYIYKILKKYNILTKFINYIVNNTPNNNIYGKYLLKKMLKKYNNWLNKIPMNDK
jgi:hypothetical protein